MFMCSVIVTAKVSVSGADRIAIIVYMTSMTALSTVIDEHLNVSVFKLNGKRVGNA